ncbi:MULTISPECIES: four helix bundle protein [Aequorivita]|uniref:Four helix bundle protein n=2 Tax=Aequorivita TaxID=153265 RepID=A0AB35YZ18_9FLAO|nr:four helix bundle protein [Aequorivita sp. Ant34-E75]WGF92331.1 four helix bundle protein [Aequorivita sp. Ant34-E75]
MKIKHNYKNLKIWQKALNIAFDTSDILEAFPQKEQYNLTSQMSRCSISIPSNIAEGSSRTDKSFNHFLDISLGSSYELSTQLLIAHHKKYINDAELEKLENNITELQMMTSGFQKTLR